jgi:hypothetical protein
VEEEEGKGERTEKGIECGSMQCSVAENMVMVCVSVREWFEMKLKCDWNWNEILTHTLLHALCELEIWTKISGFSYNEYINFLSPFYLSFQNGIMHCTFN